MNASCKPTIAVVWPAVAMNAALSISERASLAGQFAAARSSADSAWADLQDAFMDSKEVVGGSL